MSVKRVNSTGRARILRQHARFWVTEDMDGSLLLQASLDLGTYGLPADAAVFVEAYRHPTTMRFAYGCVATPRPSEPSPCRLAEFSDPVGLRFRVKVASVGDRPGLLLAEGDRIPLRSDRESPEDQEPLLPPRPEDIGLEAWRVEITDEGPFLLVNKRFGDWRAAAASPAFQSLVYPAAMRQVLTAVLLIAGNFDSEDERDWGAKWLRFAASFAGVGEPPAEGAGDAEKREWIDDAVSAFAERHRMVDRYQAVLGEEGAV